jgi:hypothetical protein
VTRIDWWRAAGFLAMTVSAAVVVGGALLLVWALLPFAVRP